jgi:predicted signal transduction protein with EAL and GGDEF domain
VPLPGGRTLAITASFGIAAMSAAGSVEEAIARADAALYKAKALGRNRVETWAEGDSAAAEAGAGSPVAGKVARPQRPQKESRR